MKNLLIVPAIILGGIAILLASDLKKDFGKFMQRLDQEAPEPPAGDVGIALKLKDSGLAIGSIGENSPASQAGLVGGERIIKIDGQSAEHLTFLQGLKHLNGAPRTKLTLTLMRSDGGEAQSFEVTLVRSAKKSFSRSELRSGQAARREWTWPPTKEAGPVEWRGNKIVSRVLPYPDFISLFIRLPIAHAVATGQGVKVALLQSSGDPVASWLVQNVAPRAEVTVFTCATNELGDGAFREQLDRAGCRVALIPDVPNWPAPALLQLTRHLIARNVFVVIPSDLSEEAGAVGLVNKLEQAGALTVGRVNRQSTLAARAGGDREGSKPFNKAICALHTDVFSAVDDSTMLDVAPVATAAGVAALAFEKWPGMSPAEVRGKIVAGARSEWQASSVESGRWQGGVSVDPVTTRYEPTDEKAVFRFLVLDAAGTLEVDTEIPWFLNLLNCQKAWEITKGKGALVVVSDQGFHIKHPALVPSIQATEHFGPLTFEAPEQNFHGTDMSRILLAVAPEVRLVPILCSGTSHGAKGDLAGNIAKSFRRAVELKADAMTASWAGWFGDNEDLQAAVRDAVDHGVAVSWFHYPKPYPGLLRSRFTYYGWGGAHLGFADRFLTDPPGFHPVEIEAGLSGTAPQAAGIAALVKSINPKLTPKQIEELIVQNATPIGGGVQIPDAYQTVLAAREAASGKD
jgi:hypothetical protein